MGDYENDCIEGEASGVRMRMKLTTKAMWLIEEYAMRTFTGLFVVRQTDLLTFFLLGYSRKNWAMCFVRG